MSDLIAMLLKPPVTCGAYMGLPFPDRRTGGYWYCKHARKIIGKGRARPGCLCQEAMKNATLPPPLEDRK